MGHSVYAKTLDVFSLQQIVMLSLISQMLRSGQVRFSPPILALCVLITLVLDALQTYLAHWIWVNSCVDVFILAAPAAVSGC